MKPDPIADDDTLEQALRRSASLVDAPESLIERAIALFEARAVAAAPAVASAVEPRRLLAALRFDSAGASALAFGRRSGTGGVRQLLFTADERDVDLRIAASGNGYALSGQVLGPDSQGCVSLRPAAGGEALQSTLDTLGEFRLPPVAAGTWLLTLELAELAIELPPVHVPFDP